MSFLDEVGREEVSRAALGYTQARFQSLGQISLSKDRLSSQGLRCRGTWSRATCQACGTRWQLGPSEHTENQAPGWIPALSILPVHTQEGVAELKCGGNSLPIRSSASRRNVPPTSWPPATPSSTQGWFSGGCLKSWDSIHRKPVIYPLAEGKWERRWNHPERESRYGGAIWGQEKPGVFWPDLLSHSRQSTRPNNQYTELNFTRYWFF